MPSIATVTVMRGELDQLQQMLPTVDWVDERHIVETGPDLSATKAVATGARVHHAPLPPGASFEAARSVAMNAISADWVLIVDTDERIPSALADHLRDQAEGWASSGIAGVWLPRLNYVLDTPLAHSSAWPDYQLRFVRRDAVDFSEKLHHAVQLAGATVHLAAARENAIEHYPFRSTVQFMDKLNRYARLEADQLADRNVTSLRPAVTSAAREFLARFVKMKGYRDGWHGLHWCLLFAMYRYLVGANRWEQSQSRESVPNRPLA